MQEGLRLHPESEQRIENDQKRADELRHHRYDQNVLQMSRDGDDLWIDHEKKLDEPR